MMPFEQAGETLSAFGLLIKMKIKNACSFILGAGVFHFHLFTPQSTLHKYSPSHKV